MNQSQVVAQPQAIDAAVNLQDLTFAWGKGPSLLDIANLQIDRGERVFLHGPSGSGKSTLLGLLGGVLTPATGCLEVLGQDLSCLGGRARDRFRADNLGIIFQMFNLLPYLSVRDNVMLSCRFSKPRAQRAAEAGGVVSETERLLAVLGLPQEALSRPVAELSVGRQQRVAAARALIGRPQLIIADEPTSALDADRRRVFVELLSNECAASGAALTFVSHDLSLAASFDRSISLNKINHASSEDGV